MSSDNQQSYFPHFAEQILTKYLLQKFVPTRLASKIKDRSQYCNYAAPEVINLANLYNHDSQKINSRMFEKAAVRGAYLSHYFVLNFAKTTCILQEHWPLLSQLWEPWLRGEGHDSLEPFNILDLGCGPASSSFAWLFHLQKNNLVDHFSQNIYCIDNAPQWLVDIQNLYDLFGIHQWPTKHKQHHLITKRLNLKRGIDALSSQKKFHLIILANVFNEVEQAQLLAQINKKLLDQKSGIVLLIEPAHQSCARTLTQIRTEQLPFTTTIAPCMHDLDCPLHNRGSRDWCFTERMWKRPPIIANLDNITGLDHTKLRWSYWMYASSENTAIEKSIKQLRSYTQSYRLVSNIIPSQSGSKVLLCGSQGLQEINLPKSLRKLTSQAAFTEDLFYLHKLNARKSITPNNREPQRGSFWTNPTPKRTADKN